jgi:hypothetical protein
MAYRVTYTAQVSWVGPGMGPMGLGAPTTTVGPQAPSGGAQTLDFFSSGTGQNTSTFTSSDITTITNAIATDLSTQMNAVIARVQAFSTGGS